VNQGDVYLVKMDPVIQSEIGKARPGVILSRNAINCHSPRVIVAPVTSSVATVYPFEVLVPAGIRVALAQ
jgi:mRNA interferase MazF